MARHDSKRPLQQLVPESKKFKATDTSEVVLDDNILDSWNCELENRDSFMKDFEKQNQHAHIWKIHCRSDSDDTPIDYESTYFELDEEQERQSMLKSSETMKQCSVIDFSLLRHTGSNEEDTNNTHQNEQELAFRMPPIEDYKSAIELSFDMLDSFLHSLHIKAKLTHKSQMKFPDLFNEEQYCICTLLDSSGVMKLVIRDNLCTALYGNLEINQIYDPNLRKRKEPAELSNIQEIQEKDVGQRIDVIGTIKKIGCLHQLNIQGKFVTIRKVIISDYTERHITAISLGTSGKMLSPTYVNQTVTIKKAEIIKSDVGKNIAVDEFASVHFSAFCIDESEMP
ncbi:hypothetical protein QAD02_003691 [Eretmocerus hayati]|uniref:Uncharacterized protein n=1 Tax=Eretmocerus hayati TaxID=131215 RepID=A0ACC2NQA9_9HYME|nr:hypothetical protein QAD02_003691 [Eretmocerus hayati]